jgi:trimethylamine--corrinoid protein Co-methyltransferase
MSVRPTVTFLSSELKEKIVSEARDILCRLGITIHNDHLLNVLSDFGGKVDQKKSHIIFTPGMIDRALETVPSSFPLYDTIGEKIHEFKGDRICFTPASSSLNILDSKEEKVRRPDTHDYVKYAKVISSLENISTQSTAFIPADVPGEISDIYRLYLSLLYCQKPVFTGTFTANGFQVMKELLCTVRGSESLLRQKPMAVFSCCSTSPLKWSDITSQNIVECGEMGIPVELISAPLSGLVAPVTLTGSLVELTVENLSGIVISQLNHPGAPLLYGGAPAIFDVRHETTPMSAIESQMINCASNEIGKYLKVPTQAFVSLSDSKLLDAQAGIEASMGALLAALSGINSIAGAGALDFVNTHSIEKLVLDNELCGNILRMVKGIEPKEDFPSYPRFEELLEEKHLIISDHTRRYLKEEHYIPGKVIDRADLSKWQQQGSQTLMARARQEVDRLVDIYESSILPQEINSELKKIMGIEASKRGMDKLPA